MRISPRLLTRFVHGVALNLLVTRFMRMRRVSAIPLVSKKSKKPTIHSLQAAMLVLSTKRTMANPSKKKSAASKQNSSHNSKNQNASYPTYANNSGGSDNAETYYT